MKDYIKDNWFTISCGFMLVLQLVFARLKTAGVVDWSLWVVLLPSILLAIGVCILVILIALVFADDDWGDDATGYGPWD